MSKKLNTDGKKPKFNYYWIYLVVAAVILFFSFFQAPLGNQEVSWKDFNTFVRNQDVEKIEIVNKQFARVFIKEAARTKEVHKDLPKPKFSPVEAHYQLTISTPERFEEKLEAIQKDLPLDQQVYPKYIVEQNVLKDLIMWLLPFVLLLGIFMFIMRRVGGGGGGPGGQIFNIGKSKATLFDKNTKVNVTFKDVAGLQEAKVEVEEVVDFLKHPKKYTALGGKIPKGVLLVGPPGTGKTLLAKAVAGEAGVPFFSISGSDFVEMFVGVGASRVRDLFKKAREKAPCIIFIDEIDAIGRQRGKGAMQGNDERENTLNQLLVEMDGFATDKGVILIAATNRPDILDSALLRPGRFDRQIGVDRPDIAGREQIFKVHLGNIKVSENVKPNILAEMTPGFVGADIANICNESALVAARRNKTEIDMDDFNYALDRVIGGLEKKNKLISPNEKKTIAFHEAGHAICGWFLEHASPLIKVTIVPRGVGTLGYAQYLPKEEYITTTEQMQDRMCMTLGGRAAEEIIFGKISTGAQNDLDQVTKMAYGMVAIYGMNDKVGNVSFYDMQNQNQFAKPYSDETAQLIDSEVRKMIEAQYQRAKDLLLNRKQELDLLALELLDKEMLLKSDVERLIGNRPFEIASTTEDVLDAFGPAQKDKDQPTEA